MPPPAVAETLRIATWHAPLVRKGPGLVLRDLLKAKKEVQPIIAALAEREPDILLLTRMDYDADGAAARVLADLVWPDARRHVFVRRPNTGMPTGRDIDGNGETHGARDAQGFGTFAGQAGLAVLSRVPIDGAEVVDFSHLLWRDLPDSRIAADDPAWDIQRLSSSAHWVLPLGTPPRLWLAVWAATPPVFDGPEDRNGRRNADEAALWRHWLDGALDHAPPAGPIVVLGNANLDPVRGEGMREAINTLRLHPRLQDPEPTGRFGTATADWSDSDTGRLRVSYILPSADLRVVDSGVDWVEGAGNHALVWVDLAWP